MPFFPTLLGFQVGASTIALVAGGIPIRFLRSQPVPASNALPFFWMLCFVLLAVFCGCLLSWLLLDPRRRMSREGGLLVVSALVLLGTYLPSEARTHGLVLLLCFCLLIVLTISGILCMVGPSASFPPLWMRNALLSPPPSTKQD